MSRRWIAEFLGTAVLLSVIVGSGLMAISLADGNLALALLGNSLATGLMLWLLISVLGPISGAHMNPAVTLTLCVTGDCDFRDLPLYWSAQWPGAICGVVIAHLMWELPVLQLAATSRTGFGQWLSELLAAAGLCFIIVAGLRMSSAQLAMWVGGYITAAYWFTVSTAFANPAVSIARSLTDSFTGIDAADAVIFCAWQFMGALLGGKAAHWLFGGARPPVRIKA